jgi:signal transduction histidine kinase
MCGVRLTVEDTGSGIAPEKRELLFRKFERLGAEKGPIEGQGLGLSIAAKLVELSGGRISVADRADGRPGTQFLVEIPQVAGGATVVATSLSQAGS